jgi:hypothetical protein
LEEEIGPAQLNSADASACKGPAHRPFSSGAPTRAPKRWVPAPSHRTTPARPTVSAPTFPARTPRPDQLALCFDRAELPHPDRDATLSRVEAASTSQPRPPRPTDGGRPLAPTTTLPGHLRLEGEQRRACDRLASQRRSENIFAPQFAPRRHPPPPRSTPRAVPFAAVGPPWPATGGPPVSTLSWPPSRRCPVPEATEVAAPTLPRAGAIRSNAAGRLPVDRLVRPPSEPVWTSKSIAPAPCSSPARRPPRSAAPSGCRCLTFPPWTPPHRRQARVLFRSDHRYPTSARAPVALATTPSLALTAPPACHRKRVRSGRHRRCRQATVSLLLSVAPKGVPHQSNLL